MMPGSPGRSQQDIKGPAMSWAERLGNSLPVNLNKNVLEIILEKDVKGGFSVSEEDVARLLKRIGLNLGQQVEGVQICPNGKGVIFATPNDNVTIDTFCSLMLWKLQHLV